jgi:hypothetical protein
MTPLIRKKPSGQLLLSLVIVFLLVATTGAAQPAPGAAPLEPKFVFEKGNHSIPVIGGFLRDECKKLFSYKAG